jgi:hypothetical protein
MSQRDSVSHYSQGTNLADILERVLDKGIVIAGDINVNIAEIELISIKIRLVVCSVDKARELGINWWKNDPYLNAAPEQRQLEAQNEDLLKRIESLEKKLAAKK